MTKMQLTSIDRDDAVGHIIDEVQTDIFAIDKQKLCAFILFKNNPAGPGGTFSIVTSGWVGKEREAQAEFFRDLAKAATLAVERLQQ